MKNKLIPLIAMMTKLAVYGLFIQTLCVGMLLASGLKAQKVQSVRDVYIDVSLEDAKLADAFKVIEANTPFKFAYDHTDIRWNVKVNMREKNVSVATVLLEIAKDANLQFRQVNNYINVNKGQKQVEDVEVYINAITVMGKVTSSEDKEGLPGVNVIVKGTAQGTVTDVEGNYKIDVPSEETILVFSSVGYVKSEITVGSRTVIDLALTPDIKALNEIVVVGYGTQKKSDLTGSVVRADLQTLAESPSTNVLESLKGTVAGLDIGQTVQAGQVPSMLIRGQTTLAGSNAPLIVVDGVIFRGSLNDINPHDIASVDVLKDASAAAVYGSQATNGVVLISTKKGGGAEGKPTISYSGSYSYKSPVRELRPPDAQGFYKQTEESQIFSSRTEESGYLEPNPDWEITNVFSVNEEGDAYKDGRTTDWYSILTNDYIYAQEHNLSMSNSTEFTNYLVSIGYNDQNGYMRNEGYDRVSVRLNLDNSITNWLKIGLQSFMSVSDYSGADANPNDRYIEPYATDKDANGERYRTILAGSINPYLQFEREDFNKSLNLFGNLYAEIEFPFVKGLSYKINFANNSETIRQYQYKTYAVDFQGEGEKMVSFDYDRSIDNILTYKHEFNHIHNIQLTLLYGLEKRQYDNTDAIGQNFINGVLGYNKLQVSNSENQQANSGAWEESSLYSMARLFYGFRNKYLLTGTIRRDGYSGFGKENKFGLFPSLSVAWNVSEESFISENSPWLSQLKIRASYGTVGNRTIGRYQTLARVNGDYGFIDMSRTPLYTQSITSLESPDLKWEKTTGTNLGVDFGILSQRVTGSIEYYINNTNDLFYQVDIPAISRYTKFPDNLGKLHNHGLEVSINSINLKNSDFEWSSSLTFSRNRNELRELLGFDLDGDGKEDDLVSEGLFIGESIDAIYDYDIDGKWQLGDEIPPGYDVGAHKPVDQNGDGVISPADDKKIIGYTSPAYSFGINNSFRYKNWTLKFLIYSIQGGKNHYLGPDNYLDFSIQNSEMHFRYIFPDGVDYWTPENPNGRYQRPDIYTASGTRGYLYGNRSFIRLQNISLSYNLPENFLAKTGLQNARIYLNGENLLTFTNWNGWDPETNQAITMDGRPVLKSYTLGLTVAF